MKPQTEDVEQLADALIGAMPPLDEQQRRLAITLYRLLAEGSPVEPERVAEHAGLRPDETGELLESVPGVHLDDGRVVGFWGLALRDMPHRLLVEGRELRAWCAWDTLYLPELIGKSAGVESPCPITGERVSAKVDPSEGVLDLSPATAVLSFLRPDAPFDADVIMSFCHFVHFFRDRAAASEWTARHESTFTLSIDEGFEIGRRTNEARFGPLLGRVGV